MGRASWSATTTGLERATRDIVSRAMASEMRAGNVTESGGLYISMAHLGPGLGGKERFKGMVERCRDCGFDLAGGLVEVVPTAHYMMGGVAFEPDTTTAMPGLYAAGEDTGGVHGANRLGGNGVANSTVYGGIAGDRMAAAAGRERAFPDPDEAVLEEAAARCLRVFDRPPGDLTGIRGRLSDLMWDEVGILRFGREASSAQRPGLLSSPRRWRRPARPAADGLSTSPGRSA